MADFNTLSCCCLLCGGRHSTISCRDKTGTIRNTGDQHWVESMGGQDYRERGTGRTICGFFNWKVVCPRTSCPFAHACTLCGVEGHPCKKCPKYRMQELEKWYREARSKSIPKVHPLIPVRSRLAMKPGPIPTTPTPTSTYVYTEDTTVYPHLPKVEIRVNSIMTLGPAHVIQAAPTSDQGCLNNIFTSITQLPSAQSFANGRETDLEYEDILHQRLKAKEEACVRAGTFDAMHFTCRGVEERFQLPDGSPTAAPIVLLLHYPSGHTDNVVLTEQAPATRLIRAHGIDPPSSTEPSLLGVYNVIPVKMAAEHGAGGGMKVRQLINDKGPRSYPAEVTNIAVRSRIEDLYTWLSSGQSKMVVMVGTSSHTKDVKDGFIAMAKDTATITEFCIARAILAEWEMGIECPQLATIRQDCIPRSKPFPKLSGPDPLFPYQEYFRMVSRSRLQAFGLETPTERDNSAIIEFTLVKIKGQDENGILLVSAPHPETVQHSVTPRQVPQQLDLVLGLVRNLVHGTSGVASFPASQAFANTKSENEATFLKTYMDAQDGTIKDGRIRYYIPSVLPPSWQALGSMVTRTTVDIMEPKSDDIKTGSLDDFLQQVVFAIEQTAPARRNRSPSYDPTGLVKYPAKAAALAASRDKYAAKRNAESSTSRVAEVGWQSVCECGVERLSTLADKVTGVPLISRVTVAKKGSKHPANREKEVGRTCLIGIPVDDQLRAKALQKVNSKTVSPMTTIVKESCERAVARFREGSFALPYDDGDWRDLKARDEADKAREKAQDEKDKQGKGKEKERAISVDSDDLDA
jgi:hypothetical protein